MPAVPVAVIPLLKVEVAPSPLTFKTFWIVEDPAMIAEDEALKSPLTWRFEPNVEEAPAMKLLTVTKPFVVSTVNIDELAEFRTLNALVVLTNVWNVVEP